jgi:hypothetical protein
MKFNLTRHQASLLVFGALSTAVVLLLMLQDWNIRKNILQNHPNVLTPERQAELWRPVKAGTSTSALTPSAEKKLQQPMTGGNTISVQTEAELFKPVKASGN